MHMRNYRPPLVVATTQLASHIASLHCVTPSLDGEYNKRSRWCHRAISPNNETVVSHNARPNRNIDQLISYSLNPHRCSETIGLAISPLDSEDTGVFKVVSCSTTQGLAAR